MCVCRVSYPFSPILLWVYLFMYLPFISLVVQLEFCCFRATCTATTCLRILTHLLEKMKKKKRTERAQVKSSIKICGTDGAHVFLTIYWRCLSMLFVYYVYTIRFLDAVAVWSWPLFERHQHVSRDTQCHRYAYVCCVYVCVCLSVLTCRPSMRVSRINARHSISKFKPKWLVTYAEIKMFKNIINFILSTLSLSFYWIEIINIFSFSLQIHYSLS